MNVNTVLLGSVLAAMLASASAAARDHDDGDNWKRQHKQVRVDSQMHDYAPLAGSEQMFYDYAKVVAVKPVIRTAQMHNPHQYCGRGASYQQTRHGAYMPLIIGGILGGVIGNQVGHGTGNDVMAVSGAILGASIGHQIARHNTNQKRCQLVHDYQREEYIEGYDVTYRYQGHTFVRRLQHPPGRKLRVRINVIPEI